MTKFLTAKVRTRIYAVLVALVPLLITLGAITPDVGGQILSVSAAVLAALGTILSLLNITPEEPVA